MSICFKDHVRNEKVRRRIKVEDVINGIVTWMGSVARQDNISQTSALEDINGHPQRR